ncbi:hypothetical protein LVJ83_11125 [Uruburuella testudinis]|uniref:Uncharacterized protein n=1 Tax=Uruburuella testudinis TaxID=1282863 RepID=A0ABY4DR12_9NEIS|nr:hypothetical protein [Uruburuella testudinis]UOO81481.1 hypothetical protein LVJ83_11125 [Uruburuella testudinis]
MKINLIDKVIYNQELSYALTYQKRSFLGKFTGILSLLLGGIWWLLEIFSIAYPLGIKSILSWSVFGLLFFTPVYIY